MQLIADTSKIGVVLDIGPNHGGLIQFYRVSWNDGTKSLVAEHDLQSYNVDKAPHEFLACGELGGYREFQRAITYERLNREKWLTEMLTRFGERFEILDVERFGAFLRMYEEAPDRAELSGIISMESLRSRRVTELLEAQAPTFDLVIVDEAHHMRNFGTQTRRAGLLAGSGSSAMVMLTATPVHLGNENLFSLLNILDEDSFPEVRTAQARFEQNAPIIQAQACIARVPPNVDMATGLLHKAAQTEEIYQNPALKEAMRKLETLGELGQAEDESRRMQLALQRDLADLNLIGHIFTRTRKREVHEHVVERHAYVLQVKFSEQERRFYDTVTELVRETSIKRTGDRVVQSWILQTPQRRMASCISAMIEYCSELAGWIVLARNPRSFGSTTSPWKGRLSRRSWTGCTTA